MRLILLFLFSLAPLFATDYNGEIYTWGYGELIKNVLDSIHLLVSGNGLATIFKIAMGIAFLVFAFKKAANIKASPQVELFKLGALALAVWYLFLTAPNDAKHRYVITDKVTNQQWVVDEIPTGIGEPLSIITTFEDRIIAAMEKVFSLPNSLTYRNSGFGFPLQDQYTLGQLSLPDTYFNLTYKDFIKNCTINEIIDGSKNVKDIITSNDLLTALDPDGDSRLSKIYTQSNPNGTTEQCQDVYNYIVDYINQHSNDLVNLAAARLHTDATTLLNRTDAVSQLFFNIGESGRNYINQNFLINLTKTAISAAAASSGLSNTQIAYATAIAKQNIQSRFAVSGILAKEYLPIMKGILLALIVSLSWIIALLAIIYFDFRYIFMYITLLLWLMLWSPILVILNYIGDMYVSKIFTQIASDTGQALTMYDFNFVNDKVTTALGWLGYLVWLVPPLAYAIVKASERGFVSFASSIASSTSAGASAGASADTQKATQATPEYRVGDTLYRDLPGAKQQIAYATVGGHQVSVTTTSTAGADNYAGEVDKTAQFAVTFSNGKIDANFSSKNVSVNVSNAVKSQAQEALKQSQKELQTARHSYITTTSGAISKAISSKGGFSISTEKIASLSQRIAVDKSFVNALSHSLKDNTQFKKINEKIQQAAAEGSLGLKISKTGAGAKITFMDANRTIGTISLDEAHAKEFREQFSKSLSTSFANNESARKGFYQALDKTETQNFSQSKSKSDELSTAYTKERSAEEAYSYIMSHSSTITQNALSMLYKDEIEQLKKRGLDDKTAAELAAANVVDYYNQGILIDKLKEEGYLSVNKPDLTGIKDEVNSKINGSALNNASNEIDRVKDKITQKGAGITEKVKANTLTPDELKTEFNQSTKNFHIGDVKLSAKNEKYVDKAKKSANGNIIDNIAGVKNQLENSLEVVFNAFDSVPKAVKFEGLTTASHSFFWDLDKRDTLAIKTDNGIIDTKIPISYWNNYLKSHPDIMEKIEANKGNWIKTIDTHRIQELIANPLNTEPKYNEAVEKIGSLLSGNLPHNNPYSKPSTFTDLSINTNFNQPSSFLNGDFDLFGNKNKFTPVKEDIVTKSSKVKENKTNEENYKPPHEYIP